MLTNLLLALLCLFVLALAFTMLLHLLVLRVPYVPTPPDVVENMMRLARLRGTEKVYDLGAGDGRLLLAAVKDHPDIRAVGVEYAPTIWLLGWLRTFRQKQIQFRLGDALKADVRDADVVFIYLLPHFLEKLTRRFKDQLRKGTVVVSHSFQLPDRTPDETVVLTRWGGRKRTLYRYVW